MLNQLAFDTTPARHVTVGNRVVVVAASHSFVARGMTGVVVRVDPPVQPWSVLTYHPVAATIDQLDGRVYAFEHEDLEVQQ